MAMQPGIGGADASRPDIGSLLAQGGAGMGGEMAGAPGMAAGPDPQLLEAVNQVRAIGDQVAQLQATYPIVADDVNQITTLLKQVVIKIAQAQSMQTASGLAVPGGGPGMGMG